MHDERGLTSRDDSFRIFQFRADPIIFLAPSRRRRGGATVRLDQARSFNIGDPLCDRVSFVREIHIWVSHIIDVAYGTKYLPRGCAFDFPDKNSITVPLFPPHFCAFLPPRTILRVTRAFRQRYLTSDRWPSEYERERGPISKADGWKIGTVRSRGFF